MAMSEHEQAIADKVTPAEKLIRKPILCLDFDGVLHSYGSGWQGADLVPDLPVPGAVEFLLEAVQRFRVAVYSSRSGQPGGIEAMRGWLTLHVMATIDDRREAQNLLQKIEWPTEKPPAVVTLDDRALTFTGTWPSIDALASFQPWTKQGAGPAAAEKAYGILWRIYGANHGYVHDARALLREALDKPARRRGIAWATEKYGRLGPDPALMLDDEGRAELGRPVPEVRPED